MVRPTAKLQLVVSGVPALDGSLGGIPVYDVTLLIGAARAGKTTFVLATAIEALRRNDSVCFVTNDAPEAVLAVAAHNHHADLTPFVRAGKLSLLAFGPNFQNKLLSLGSAEHALREIEAIAAERHARTLVFDTLDPFLAASDLGTVKALAGRFLASLRRLSLTTLCTSVRDVNDTIRVGVEEIALAASAAIELRGRGEERWMSVRGDAFAGATAEIPIELAPGTGLIARRSSAGGEPLQSPPPGPPPPPEPPLFSEVHLLHAEEPRPAGRYFHAGNIPEESVERDYALYPTAESDGAGGKKAG